MTRRIFIAAFVPAMTAEETPRNKMAIIWNELQQREAEWADTVMKMEPGTISVAEAALYERIEHLYPKWRTSRNNWIRGMR